MTNPIKHLLLAALMALGAPLSLTAAEGDTLSLDEKWLFCLSRSDSLTPQHFCDTTFEDGQWRLQAVPGLWRVPTGWGRDNYVGIYRGWIKVPETFAGRRIILHLGLTTTTADVYLNGEQIGTTARDRAQTEIDITPHVRPGQRDLYVIRMHHYDGDGDLRHRGAPAGITTHSFVYALDDGQQPAGEPTLGRAPSGTRIASRYNVHPTDAFLDSPDLMRHDLHRLRTMGFSAISYDKLGSDPAFMHYAQRNGWTIVRDAPTTQALLIDDRGAYTFDAYALLTPDADHCQKAIVHDAGEAVKGKKIGKPKVKDGALITISGPHYQVAIDRHSGLLATCRWQGTTLLNAVGCVRPNAKATLQSITVGKANKIDGVAVTAVFQMAGGRQEQWTYSVAPSGLLTIAIDGESDVLLTPAAGMGTPTYLAQDYGPDVLLTRIGKGRPRVIWVQTTNGEGQGFRMMFQEPFTACQAPQGKQVLMKHAGGSTTLHLFPVE